MINLDFSLAIALYTIFCMSIVLLFWILSKKEKYKDVSLDPKFIWHCEVCAYTYVNTKEDTISVCPRCSSYNKKIS